VKLVADLLRRRTVFANVETACEEIKPAKPFGSGERRREWSELRIAAPISCRTT
jgi:hypothetical protein